MKDHDAPKGGFELDLLDELKGVVALRNARLESETTAGGTAATKRLAPRLAFGGAAMAAAVAAVLAISAGSDSTSSAYAVESQEGGGLTVKIYSLDDAAGLEEALDEAGVPSQVNWLAAGMACKEPRFKASQVNIPMPGGNVMPFSGFDVTQVDHLFGESSTGEPASPLTIGIGNLQQREALETQVANGEISAFDAPQFTVDPTAFKPDQTLVLSGSQVPYDGDPEGGSAAHVRIAEGDVAPCDPVPVGS